MRGSCQSLLLAGVIRVWVESGAIWEGFLGFQLRVVILGTVIRDSDGSEEEQSLRQNNELQVQREHGGDPGQQLS